MSKRPSPSHHHRAGPGNQALEQAVLALRMQRPDEAERIALAVLKSDRGNVIAAQILGRALILQNRVEDAIEPLQKAAKRSEDPETETVLAAALAAAGRDREAVDQLRQTAARRPLFPPAVVELSGQLAKAGRFDEGIAILQDALDLAPDVLDLQMALGQLHAKKNDRAKAIAIFSKIRETSPERHDTLLALAKVLALDGNYAAAADVYRHALALRPDDLMARNNLGKCLLEMGDREAGEAALRASTRGTAQLTGPAIRALAASSHGRLFMRPSDAVNFFRADKR